MLQMDTGKIPVYCEMTGNGTGACQGGGWTLAMKIDGKQDTFHYDSIYWSDKLTYNLGGGETGFDAQQTKLPTYWNTPFSKICLGMKIDGVLRFIVINQTADSLYQLIADGSYRATELGRDAWKTLIGAQASLETYCDQEGFNAAGDDEGSTKARIGILGNDQNDCGTCDSRIGFGTAWLYDVSTNTCGNEAQYAPLMMETHTSKPWGTS